MKAWIFPGQGAQTPGMGKDFHDKFPVAKRVFEQADDLLKQNFSKLIFESDAKTLSLTKNSQLAIYVVSIAVAEVLKLETELPGYMAGLSLGEYTALTLTGRAKFEDVLMLVKRRGELMHEASLENPGTLAAVLGMDLDPLQEVCEKFGLWVANLNCPGQIVIAGTHEGIEQAGAALKVRGAKRVIPLDVSGAFHSGLMQPARNGLAPFVEELQLFESDIRFPMNVVGEFVEDDAEIRANLVEQVTATVKWQGCVETMIHAGVLEFIEIGPGNTLAGMNRKINREVKTHSGESLCSC